MISVFFICRKKIKKKPFVLITQVRLFSKKIFSQFHLLSGLYPAFFVSFKIRFRFLSLIQFLRLARQFKRHFLVFGSLFFDFKSLGLDMTPVLLFLMLSKWQQHTPCWLKNHTDNWFPVIHFESKKFDQLQQVFFLLQTCLN